jgi:hypothetical protein
VEGVHEPRLGEKGPLKRKGNFRRRPHQRLLLECVASRGRTRMVPIMPSIAPLTASGSRELKRKRAIPPAVKNMVKLMVYGQPDDPDCMPVPFIEAGRECGIKPDIARRYLDRPDVRALLHAERRAYRSALCAANEGALARVRDTSQNGMCVVHAVRTLEAIQEDDAQRGGNLPRQQAPGLVIVITPPRDPLPQPQPITIDAMPAPEPES